MIEDENNFYFPFEYASVKEAVDPEGYYHEFYELNSRGQKTYTWATANPGFNILAATLVPEGEDLTPAFYPTAQVEGGFIGKGVKMETKSTGVLGGMFGSPLAAGNLYIGDFVLTFPTINSTHFGLPYLSAAAPIALKGFFYIQSRS